MKLRITHKDLEELTFEQKQNLCDLWIPHIFDTSVATVCVDAAEERFEQIVFVIGGIKLLKHSDMLLYDLKFMPDIVFKVKNEELEDSEDTPAESTDISEPEEEESTEDQEFSFDEDFNFEFQRPDSFSKQDCLPLLDIGQMIDILERKNFSQGDFYLSAAMGDYVFETGKNEFSGTIDYDVNNKECELCDVLWESIKAIL